MLFVVPHAGTWIEIDVEIGIYDEFIPSFPTRERGLKSHEHGDHTKAIRRAPRGNVD